MSDTSWIKPGMYVTWVPVPVGVDDDRPTAVQVGCSGDVYRVLAMDGDLVAVEALSGWAAKDDGLKRMAFDLRHGTFRELSPSYVEAMTGEKVDKDAELAQLRKELEQAKKDLDAYRAAAPPQFVMKARSLGMSYYLAHAVEVAQLRERTEKAEAEAVRWRQLHNTLKLRFDTKCASLKAAEAKLAAIRKEIESC